MRTGAILTRMPFTLVAEFVRHQLWKRFEQPFFTRYLKLLEDEVCGGCRTLLDIGCGGGGPASSFSGKLAYSVGVDAYAPALEIARQRSSHHDYVLANVEDLRSKFAPKSFDCVLAFDLIEHLKKDEGLALLDAMECISRKKVIVFTPNGFLPQSAVGDNPFRVHCSGWTVAEFAKRGYRVRGVHGLRWILGEEANPRWKPIKFWRAVAVATEPVLARLPRYSFQLFCVKNIADCTDVGVGRQSIISEERTTS